MRNLSIQCVFLNNLMFQLFKNNVQLRVVNYILYGNGKSIRGISHTNIQLVRTCLVLNWDQEQDGSTEEVHASFIEVKANDLIRDFIRIELVKSTISYTGKRYDRVNSELISKSGLDRININPFSSNEWHLLLEILAILSMILGWGLLLIFVLAVFSEGLEKLSSYESGMEPMGNAWLQFRPLNKCLRIFLRTLSELPNLSYEYE